MSCSNSALSSVQLPITSLPTPASNASNTASPFITIGNNTALTQLDLGRLTVLPGSQPLQISNNTVLTAVNLTAVSADLHRVPSLCRCSRQLVHASTGAVKLAAAWSVARVPWICATRLPTGH